MSNDVKPATRFETSQGVLAALREAYAPPDYAMLTEVPNGTGGHKTRSADALVMSLWPSRGLTLVGIEIKVSRSDWLTELKDPSKADAICRYCDRWFIAAGDANIVRDGELPDTWGLLVPKNGKMVVKRQGPTLEPVPIDRPFLAALFRRVNESNLDQNIIGEMRIRHDGEVRRAKEEGRELGRQAIINTEGGELKKATDRVRELERHIKEFEGSSGVPFHPWMSGHIGSAVEFVLNGGIKSMESNIVMIRKLADSLVKLTDEYQEQVRNNSGNSLDVKA